ncbi:MAG: precorrin-6A reductase [Muribaculaceae bacterium]|nr:precorrin-6A reductase [Muribaculaceae bacterium]
MKKLLIFAGTTEGRQLSEALVRAEIAHTVCVATAYGEIVLEPHALVTVRRGRMQRQEIEEFLKTEQFEAVIDATHPFATEITANIKAAIAERKKACADIVYLRLKREGRARQEDVTYFETKEACAAALEHTEGNILLTTGSKELGAYCQIESVRNRLYVRVLPSMESISLCEAQGIYGKHILAMQGPFSAEMNEAILRQYHISCLVTKESGLSGGYPEKVAAAAKMGVQVFVLGCPKEDEGYSFYEICRKLEGLCAKKIRAAGRLEIVLAGVGMGHENCLTKEAERAIKEADILMGAERLLETIPTAAEKYPYYQIHQIIPCLQEIQERNRGVSPKKIGILFSGDSGFYSGCQTLYPALQKEILEKRLAASLHVLPGISSVAYLAACIGESYQDSAIYSIHGKKLCNLARRIAVSPKTFLLTSGVGDINRLGRLLLEENLTECKIIIGYQLSYENQRIENYTPAECCTLQEEGLYTCLVKNPHALSKRLTHGMADTQFIRDKVPMTKEEVREVSLCKLRLWDKAVVYDIGSGTGSMAVEIAALSDDISVYAIDAKKEALSLLEKNRDRFHLENLIPVEKTAPEGLSDLPAATHAFIGGSGGRLKEILETLQQINPRMRVVINAVSLETICELKEILTADRITDEELIQLQVNKVKEAGNYHLLQSENPVWICSFNFSK